MIQSGAVAVIVKQSSISEDLLKHCLSELTEVLQLALLAILPAFKLFSHVRNFICCVFYYFDADMCPAVVLTMIFTWSAYSVYQLCCLIPAQIRARRDIK